MKSMINHIFNKDCLSGLREMPDDSLDCCVTSPPYWGLRDYGHNDQLGLESTPEQYVENMVKVFREVRRVLKPTGTLWVNLGDSYMSNPNADEGDLRSKGRNRMDNPNRRNVPGYKLKDLVGIPWMVAFALRSDGWYLRQDIIWHKPNPMPESVTDRCTKSHEYIFLLSKSGKYYYDQEAIKSPVAGGTLIRMNQQIETQNGSGRVVGKNNGNMKAVGPGRVPRKAVDTRGGNQGGDVGIPAMSLDGAGLVGHSGYFDGNGKLIGGGRVNKKSVWTVTTKPFKEAHFATYPPDLIVDCIKAGCPEGGIVLDPFMGAGTTALVARKLNRNYIGFELNESYIKLANKRLLNELGMFY